MGVGHFSMSDHNSLIDSTNRDQPIRCLDGPRDIEPHQNFTVRRRALLTASKQWRNMA